MLKFNGRLCFILFLFVLVLLISPLIATYYFYSKFSTYVNSLINDVSKYGIDGLSDVSLLRKLVQEGKSGGFAKLQHETLDRIFIVTHAIPPSSQKRNNNNKLSDSSISFLGLDVSHAGEALYIYKRILSKRSFKAKKLIVDIGANDGLMSSNSFNFIQWGWDAVLVEPQKDQLKYAQHNTRRYRNPYKDGQQRVDFVQAVISDKSGFVDLVVTDDLVSMEAHVKTSNTAQRKGKMTKVRSMTVADLTEEYNIPNYFGILSIDAEGVGDKILRAWVDRNFRPSYIIYEALHNQEPLQNISSYLSSNGYKYLTKRGWNHIFEYKSN